VIDLANTRLQRTALRAAAEAPGRWADMNNTKRD
jgi:hypothetical protein